MVLFIFLNFSYVILKSYLVSYLFLLQNAADEAQNVMSAADKQKSKFYLATFPNLHFNSIVKSC